jgi:hypothetical protein
MPGNPGERTGGIFFGVNGVNLHRYEEIIYGYTFLLPSDKRSRFVAEQGKSHGRHPEKERILQDHSLHLLPGKDYEGNEKERGEQGQDVFRPFFRKAFHAAHSRQDKA